MAEPKKRFFPNTMQDAAKVANSPRDIDEKKQDVPVSPKPTAVVPVPDLENEKSSYKEPNKLFRRNITLSEEVYWCLNYIKDRKNKNRTDGAKFVAIDGLMFEMIQHCLDTQYASVKKKFEEYKKEETEDWI